MVREKDSPLQIAGRNFPANETLTLSIAETPKLRAVVKTDKAGQFSLRMELTEDLGPGTYRVEISDGDRILTFDDFRRPYGEDGDEEDQRAQATAVQH